MPIDIQPTATGQKMMNKKMDKIGGGGMDIPMMKMKKKMNMSGKMEDMREYMDILDGIEEDTLDEGAVKDMMQDVEEGMSKEEFEKEYPGMGDEYDKIKKEIMDRADEDTVSENNIMDPETKKMIPEKDYVMKYVMAKHPEATKKLLQSKDLMDIYDDQLYMDLFDYFSEEMPYGTQKGRDGDPVQYMQDELDSMGIFGEPTSKFDIYNRKPAESVDEQDIEMEEDCGCDDEAIDAMVSVPVQELADILQLAGYENYADKIEEYANEPEEEYSDTEDQLIGLSGGLNRPKKQYPASAPGDNPMDQEPREIEESVEDKLYKSYKDFLESEEIK